MHGLPSFPFEQTGADCRMRSMAVMFTDMAGSSRFAEKFGARAAFFKRKRHNALLVPLLDSHRGMLVEIVGDALLAVFEVPSDAARCAIAMQQRLVEYNASDEIDVDELEIHIRIGMHIGKLVVYRRVDHIEVAGRAVNVAARIESGDRKRTDQILLSGTMAAELQQAGEFSTTHFTTINPKGVGRLQLHRLAWEQQPAIPQKSGSPDESRMPSAVLSATSVNRDVVTATRTINVRACHSLFLDLQNRRGHVIPVWVRLEGGGDQPAVRSHVDCDASMLVSTQQAVCSVLEVLRNFGFSDAMPNKYAVEWWVGEQDVRYEGASLGLAIALATVAAYSGLHIDPQTAVTGEVLWGRVLDVAGVWKKWATLRAAGSFSKMIVSPGNLADLPCEAWKESKLQIIAVPTLEAAVAEVFGSRLGLAGKSNTDP